MPRTVVMLLRAVAFAALSIALAAWSDLGSPLVAAAPDEAATALAAKVGELIKRLDAPRLAERDAAEKSLIALGPEALDVLPRGPGRLSAEVKQRLVRVRRQLELEFARSAAKASLITLADAERPLSEVLAALAKQSGNPLIDGRKPNASGDAPADPRIRVAFDKSPFWQSLDTTLDAAGVSLEVRDARGEEPLQLVVVERGETDEPRATGAVYRGPIRFAIVGADIKPNAGASGRLVRIVLETAWEPRLQPIALSLAASDLTAVDDQRRPLRAASADAQWATSSLGGQGAIRLTLPYVVADADARSIALNGRMSALLAGENVVFRFERLGGVRAAPGLISEKLGDATVRVESFRRHDDAWLARVRVIYDNPQEAVQSHYDWLYKSRASLVSGDSRREPTDFDATAAEDGVIATYAFAAKAEDKPGDLALRYSTPAVIMTVPFEFEFAEIALPK